MEELKRCPFCGGKAKIVLYKRLDNPGLSVECIRCGANIGTFATKEEAIDSWNIRYRKE